MPESSGIPVLSSTPDHAGYLLKEGIYLIRAAYFAQGIDKSMRAIEDELGIDISIRLIDKPYKSHTMRLCISPEPVYDFYGFYV